MEISIKKCNELIPPRVEKMIGRLKVAVYAWRHCNEIEATLLKVRDHIRACHRRFVVSFRPALHIDQLPYPIFSRRYPLPGWRID